MIFDYPTRSTARRYGPRYTHYKNYRDWLRDEFEFRCVFCLKRETWGTLKGEFDLEHFEPQSLKPDLTTDYSNLLYACHRCNLVKGNQEVSDPFECLRSEKVEILSDGTVHSNDPSTRVLITQLDLNSDRVVEYRKHFIDTTDLASKVMNRDSESELARAVYYRIVGFPKNLPDLSKLKPEENSRPEGINQSWFALREAGDLPDEY